MVKNPPANAGDIRDAGSIPGSGRSLEEDMATHSSILAWRIPWTEELGRPQSMESQRVGHVGATQDTHIHAEKQHQSRILSFYDVVSSLQ